MNAIGLLKVLTIHTDLIAILHSLYSLVAIVRGFVSLVHELSFTVGIWSMFLFTILLDTKSYIMLPSTRVMSPECAVSSWTERTGEVSARLNYALVLYSRQAGLDERFQTLRR